MITGENIKRLRKKYNLTQTELANKIGRTLRTVQKYEAGEMLPPVDIIYKINDIFGGEFMLMFEIEEKEMVDHPSHYNMGKYECLDVVKELVKDMKGIEATLFFNAFKYLWRYKQKNGLQDLKKCEFYLKELISLNEGYQE